MLITDDPANQPDIDALIDGAALPQRSVDLCLRGDLQAEWETLDKALADTQRPGFDSLGGDTPEAEAIAERMETLRDQMAKATVTFTFQAVSGRRWAALLAEHPVPEDGTDAEKGLGLNLRTFFPTLLIESTVTPDMGKARWDRLIPKLSDAQWAKLTNAVWMLNRGEVEVPFSRDASRIVRASANASKPPTDSGLA